MRWVMSRRGASLKFCLIFEGYNTYLIRDYNFRWVRFLDIEAIVKGAARGGWGAANVRPSVCGGLTALTPVL